MLVPFDQIPDTARIWIFQSAVPLNESQMEEFHRVALSFVDSWTAHSKELKASFIIVDQTFLIFSVDESATGASGCSIDKLHHFIKGREQAMNLSLLNRLLVATPGTGTVNIFPFSDFTRRIERGEITPDQQVYDCTLTRKGELKERFISPLSSTWLNRYLPV